MEVATPNVPLDGFVEVPTDFIASLTSRRDPLFFETPEKESNVNDDNKSDVSDDVQIVEEYASTDSPSVQARAESVIVTNSNNLVKESSSITNGISHGDPSSNISSEVPASSSNLNNGVFKHSENNCFEKNSSDSGNCVEVNFEPSNSSVNNPVVGKEKVIIISPGERKFREELRGNFIFLDYRLHCTICDLHIGARADSTGPDSAALHEFLGVLICCQCKRFTQVPRSITMIGNHYDSCSWCNQVISVSEYQRCSECPCVFCERCIKRNLGTAELMSVRRRVDWKCYICVTQPIWRLRLIAWDLLLYLRRKRMHLKKAFPNAAPGEIQDVDLARCCQSTSSVLKRPHLPTAGDNRMALTSSSLKNLLTRPNEMPPATVYHQHLFAQSKPPMQQSSYATPIFSLTSDLENTSGAEYNHHPQPTSQSSYVSELQTYKMPNSVHSLSNPTQTIVIDDITGRNVQNGRNENLPPPVLLVYNQQKPVIGNNTSPYFSTISGPKSVIQNKTQTRKIISGQRKQATPTTGNSSNVDWINNAIFSSVSVLNSCRQQLSLIEREKYAFKVSKDDKAIMMASKLHTLIQTVTSEFQDIDSQILENYWSIRKAKGKNYKAPDHDTIAKEYGSIIEDMENNTLPDLDLGSILQVEINGNTGTNCVNSKSEVNFLKAPVVKLKRCDLLPSPRKSKLAIPFKSSKKISTQYSEKIMSLIERYGISESSVVLVRLEHLKSEL